jgi:hypothetical protein
MMILMMMKITRPINLSGAVTAKERGLMTPMMSVIQAPIIVWKLAINPAYMRVNFINQLFFGT